MCVSKLSIYFEMKSILVTGANKGIGFQIVKKLLKDFNNTHLFLGSRNIQLGEEAVNKIVDELGKIHQIISLFPTFHIRGGHQDQSRVGPD